MSDSIIQIQKVNKWFGEFQVLKEMILLVIKLRNKKLDTFYILKGKNNLHPLILEQ